MVVIVLGSIHPPHRVRASKRCWTEMVRFWKMLSRSLGVQRWRLRRLVAWHVTHGGWWVGFIVANASLVVVNHSNAPGTTASPFTEPIASEWWFPIEQMSNMYNPPISTRPPNPWWIRNTIMLDFRILRITLTNQSTFQVKLPLKFTTVTSFLQAVCKSFVGRILSYPSAWHVSATSSEWLFDIHWHDWTSSL